ncbi:MAG: adenylate/guanylate cyclase domain-containing protein [Chitinophagaceae bacterium]
MSFISQYRLRWLLIIAFSWTAVELLLYGRVFMQGVGADYPYLENTFSAYFLRAVILLSFSALMAYMLLVDLRIRYRNISLLGGWSIKTLLLLVIALLVTIFIFFCHFIIVTDVTFDIAYSAFKHYFFHTGFFIDSLLSWLIIILVTQVVIEMDHKYSPGVFWEILTGKYLHPRTETRILMFLDLVDSTPIAEQLGHEKYFSFIRDFIYYVSNAVLENGGSIYQYVGDEVVVSWPYKKQNLLKSTNTVIQSRRALQHASDYFRRKYNIIPDFRVGLHVGDVTIGEIGVIKKDIAISGDAMNITARIRTACSELNQKFIASQAYFENNVFESWQGESLGEIALKGVETPLQLYALKI